MHIHRPISIVVAVCLGLSLSACGAGAEQDADPSAAGLAGASAKACSLVSFDNTCDEGEVCRPADGDDAEPWMDLGHPPQGQCAAPGPTGARCGEHAHCESGACSGTHADYWNGNIVFGSCD